MPKPAPVDYPIHELLRERWSPNAFDPDRPVIRDQLRLLFEAARWSMSAGNEQPWRFVIGTRDGDREAYDRLLSCLAASNHAWAQTAPLLGLAIARTTRPNDQPNRTALYDTGQAMACLTVQASALGLLVHQMGGFSVEKARELFSIPADHEPMAAFAIGYEGDPAILSEEKYRERHQNPVRTRRPLSDLVFSGASGDFATPSPLLDAAAE